MSWDDDVLMGSLKRIAKDHYLYEDEQGEKTVYRASVCNPVLHYIVDGIRELLGLCSYGVLRTTNVTKKILLLDTPHTVKEGKIVIEAHCVYTPEHRTIERDEEIRRWLIYRELLNLVATPFLLVEREGEVVITAQPESIYSFETKKFTSFQISDKNIATYFGSVMDFSRYASRWVEEYVTDRFYDEATDFIKAIDERMIWILGHIRQREAMLRGISPDDETGPPILRILTGGEFPLPWMLSSGEGVSDSARRCLRRTQAQLDETLLKEKILAAG